MDEESLRAFDEIANEVAFGLWPVAVTIGGTEYAAISPPPPAPALLGDMGSEETVERVFWIRKETMPTAPARDARLTHGEMNYQIRSITASAAEASWCLRCEAAN